ncbi:hypothetical protein SACS_1567 [Parasaccharibacter apium]|uniref:Uncharacterized protein n=1 Tax=Parasaccharibacter apium TaxID=1510841 RepID=A0A7U7G786_9PROT|nr:hypothetical protein SACS_1567 [Parasaccharibacter apium]
MRLLPTADRACLPAPDAPCNASHSPDTQAFHKQNGRMASAAMRPSSLSVRPE